ncbi:MAG: hypothetical protein J5605_05015, partial [Bacteroidales bacterium]|nr:hypothetical protein [Bacteroidales bacterium]
MKRTQKILIELLLIMLSIPALHAQNIIIQQNNTKNDKPTERVVERVEYVPVETTPQKPQSPIL